MSRAIGVILPSSNRIVERATRFVLENVPDVDACFTRVPYSGHPDDGYDFAPFRQASRMLAEAQPDVILWNATRGALLGFEADRRLCTLIENETGIPTTTTALATIEALSRGNLRKIGLVSQGTDAEGIRLRKMFAQEGVEVAAVHNFGILDNFAAARISEEDIADKVIRLASRFALDALLVWSTNLTGYRITSDLTARLVVPVMDSATIGTSRALHLVCGQPALGTAQSQLA